MGNGQPPPRLVLWDIDHTLIETGGVGSELTRIAFAQITGRPTPQIADATGKTEPSIVVETLRLNGIEPTDDHQRAHAEALPSLYRQHADDLRQRGRALPGAAAALEALSRQPNVVQTVLTGNYRAVAVTKLQVFGLADFIDVTVGAYGDDHTERPRLVAIAQRRATEAYGYEFSRSNTIIVGDSVQDIAAAHEGGAIVIAVATGRDSRDELVRAGADHVLDDLTDTANIVQAVTEAVAGDDTQDA